MSRTVIAPLAIVLALILAACGGDSPPAEPGGPADTAPTTETAPPADPAAPPA